MEGLLQPNWFDWPAIPHNLFREEEVGNLATTVKLDEPSETESSDEEEWVRPQMIPIANMMFINSSKNVNWL